MPGIKKFPVQVVDAGKFLHQINMGAQAQISIFEERVKFLGNELGKEWSLVSVDRNNLVIEDKTDNKYFQADVENLGNKRIRIHNIKELRIVESKKENSFRKNLVELVNAIGEDKIKDAEAIFGRVAKQRFRSSVIPEHGLVTTRDGVTRYVKTENENITTEDKDQIVKSLAAIINGGVRVNRGGIVEATFNSQKITIPITELTSRKIVAKMMKEAALNAYKSDGFQNRIKHVATLLMKEEVKEAVKNIAEFTSEQQEFCLLNHEETQNLIADSLAASLCLNKQLAEDIGTLFFKTCCRINKDTIIEEWRKTARMTEYAPFVENVRILAESKNFEEDYNKFLNALFTEEIIDLKKKAGVYVIPLRKICETCSQMPEGSVPAGVCEQVQGYLSRLEQMGDNVDNKLIEDIENLFNSLNKEVINAASEYQRYASFDKFTNGAGSDIEPKQFGADVGGVPAAGDAGGMGGGMGGMGGGDLGGMEMGGAPEAAPMGAEAGVGGEGPTEQPGAEGEPGAPEEEEEALDIAGMFGEGFEHLKKFQFKKKSGDGAAPAEKPEDEEKGEEKDTKTESVVEIRKVISGLKPSELNEELATWQKDAPKFFMEDGFERSKVHLEACADQAKALNLPKVAAEFKNILIKNTPTNARITETETSDDPYHYPVSEDHVTWSKKMQETEDGVTRKAQSASRPSGGAMGKAGEKNQNVAAGLGHKEATLKETHEVASDKMKESETGLPDDGKKVSGRKEAFGSAEKPENMNVAKEKPKGGGLVKKGKLSEAKLQCPACNGVHNVVACMGEDVAMCPDCGFDVFDLVVEAVGTMESPEGKGLADKSIGKIKNSSGGEKPSNDSPEGKGVQKAGLGKVDTGSGSKTATNDSPEGKSIAGKVKGEVSEAGRRPPTSRKGLMFPYNKNSGFTTEDNLDSIVASVIAEEDDEQVDSEIAPAGDVASPMDAGGSLEGGDEAGLIPEPPVEGEPTIGDEPIGGGPDDLAPAAGDIVDPMAEPPGGEQEITVKPNSQIRVKIDSGDEGAANEVTLMIQPETTDLPTEPPASADDISTEVDAEGLAPEIGGPEGEAAGPEGIPEAGMGDEIPASLDEIPEEPSAEPPMEDKVRSKKTGLPPAPKERHDITDPKSKKYTTDDNRLNPKTKFDKMKKPGQGK